MVYGLRVVAKTFQGFVGGSHSGSLTDKFIEDLLGPASLQELKELLKGAKAVFGGRLRMSERGSFHSTKESRQGSNVRTEFL